MPGIILPTNELPKRKFFTNIKQHTRHFNGIHENTSSSSFVNKLINTSNRSIQHLTLSDNAKFMGCCFMWYLCSSLSSNTGKLIMNNFKYPVTLTFVQFFCVAVWCTIVEQVLVRSSGIKRPTRTILQTIAPLSSFMIVGHVFSSVSISRIPVSLVHTIKALAPLFTVLFYRFIFHVQYSSKIYTALVPLTAGVILACSFTFSNNVVGLACALCSCLVFVMQNIFSKKLIFKESKMGESNPNKLNKMNMMFYSSMIAFVLMSPLWFYSDGVRFLFHETQRHVSKSELVGYFLINGTTHFAQNWFAFTTLQMSSPVTYSIASLVKRIFVIVISILWFGQQVSLVQSLGIVLTFLGLYMYQQAKQEVSQGETQICELPVLPTNTTKKWSSNSRDTKLL